MWEKQSLSPWKWGEKNFKPLILISGNKEVEIYIYVFLFAHIFLQHQCKKEGGAGTETLTDILNPIQILNPETYKSIIKKLA